MHVTMVKKLLEGGRACDKCVKAEELLKSKGLWGNIHEVIWAIDGDPESPGMTLAAQKGVQIAPFFIVRDGTEERIYESVLRFIKECFVPTQVTAVKDSTIALSKDGQSAAPPQSADASSPTISASQFEQIADKLHGLSPQQVVNWALERFGADCAISFSGAEDVMLIDLAKQSGRPFSVFCLDTGRLHPQTHEFIERVRVHYGISIELMSPKWVAVEDLVRNKGLFSFYTDGHEQCCAIRKVEPLVRALGKYRAWVTGQRRDQSPTRHNLEVAQLDEAHQGSTGPLLKLNPLAQLSLADVWNYLREHGVPYNPLHDRGFVSIGCAPCTRAIRPGEHERAGRWWWEDATKRECGLHVPQRHK